MNAGTAGRITVGLVWTDCVTDDSLGGGDVTHSDTFHTGRPLRDGGLSQVAAIGLSSRDLFWRSEKRSSFRFLTSVVVKTT